MNNDEIEFLNKTSSERATLDRGISMSDFIGIYDGALTPQQCDAIAARFEASDKVVRGRTGNGVDTSKKDSWDLTIGAHKEWHDVGNLMMGAVAQHLASYIDQYRALVLGALAPMVAHPRTGEPVALSLENFDECGRPHLAALLQSMYRCGAINLQKYLQGTGATTTGIPRSIRRTPAARRCTGCCCSSST
jgi:hypothetical protein